MTPLAVLAVRNKIRLLIHEVFALIEVGSAAPCAGLNTSVILAELLYKIYKVYSRIGHEGPEEEQRYMSTLSLTSALDGGGWLTRRPGCFSPRKDTWYPLYRRLGGPQGWYGRVRKISPPPGIDPPTIQPVASLYTDWAIPDHRSFIFLVLFPSLAY